MDPRRSRLKKLVLISPLSLLAIACGSPTVSNVAKTNVNSVDPSPYLRSENAYTFAQNSELGTLVPSGKKATELVGKTATEAKLFSNRKVYSRLQILMGPDYSRMRKFWNVETPIKKFGDFLMMTGCEQHNCGDNQYVIFMDLGLGAINVHHVGKGTSKVWNGGHEMKLPPPFEEELDAMKKLD